MKRFYKSVAAVHGDEGFEIHLDGKPVRTPGKALLKVPNQPLAEALAKEWSDQRDTIELGIMPLTRVAYSAIDHVAKSRADVVDQIAKYAETDLVCYRAAAPFKLREFQINAWQPMVDWLEERFAVKLAITDGVMPVPQDPAHLATIREVIDGIDDFRLAAMREITTASDSVVVALALWDNAIEPDLAWRVAQVEEDFQIGFWGDDLTAIAMREGRKQALMSGATVLRLLNG
jgi:chaperone required for assembly of F1-ATPase